MDGWLNYLHDKCKYNADFCADMSDINNGYVPFQPSQYQQLEQVLKKVALELEGYDSRLLYC